VDESATIIRAHPTALGVGRNITNETEGGLDCRIDQFWVQDEPDGTFTLRQWVNTLVGACPDVPAWTDTTSATVVDESIVIVDALVPFTLVDDTGLTTDACTSEQSAGERGGDAGYCVPLFRYHDDFGDYFTPATPPVPNSISAVTIVVSANVADKFVPVSRSKTVSPNHYRPTSIISEVAPPSCPASLNRTVNGTQVTLRWVPVEGASQYRVVRTISGATTTLATLPVTAMAQDESPSYVDSIANITAAAIVYQVIPMVDGVEPSGCPQTIVSVQVTPPDVSVEVVGSGGPDWQGARVSDAASAFTTLPALRASWPAVPGATGYEAEIREMHPQDDSGPMTGWSAFTWDGGAAVSSLVEDTSVQTTSWRGAPLFSRAFQVRVRALSETGASPWTYCYMAEGAPDAGYCGQFPLNTFPNAGLNGYLVMPAPGVMEVTDIARSYAANNASIVWGKSPAWLAGEHNRDVTFYRVQQDSHDGVNTAVSYSASAYSTIIGYTTAESGTATVTPGDWGNFRVLRCNSINPYGWGGLGAAYSGTGSVQCSPASRVWSSVALPGVPNVNAVVDSVANTNTVRWGKHASTTTPDYSAQHISHYDVAEAQGGGPGTTAASGSTTTYVDTVTGDALTSPWLDNITSVNQTHPRREGDFTRYRALACNVTVNGAATPGWLAGVTGEAGQGVGVESCSDWSGDSQRYWQQLGAPACVAAVTWNSVSGAFSGNSVGGIYVSPADTVTAREIGRANTSVGATWWRGAPGASPWQYVWTDDLVSGDAAEGTVKPASGYAVYARVTAQYAGAGVGTCASGVIPNPPMTNPSASASVTGVTNTLLPVITRTWNGGVSSLGNAAVTQVRQTASGNWSAAARTGSTSSTGSWGSTHYMQVRSAATQRLANWGFWAQANAYVSQSAATYGGGVCPVTTPIDPWRQGTAGNSLYAPTYISFASNGCTVERRWINNTSSIDFLVNAYFFPREKERCQSGWWGQWPVPPSAYEHCASDQAIRDYARVIASGTQEGIPTGTPIDRYTFYYGSPLPSSTAFVRTWSSALVSQFGLPSPQNLPGGCPSLPALSCP